jgi:hypothetical protein
VDYKRLQVKQPNAHQRHQRRYNSQNPESNRQTAGSRQGRDYYRCICHCAKTRQWDASNSFGVPASKNGGTFVAATNVTALNMLDCQVTAIG